MGINPTQANFKSFTFDGENSRNYGVYITGQGVFNAPERNVEMVEIPGRNGAYALDKGTFNNIEVTYPAGIFADTETDFAEAVSDLRNFLCSRVGYVRLEDDYNPNEYRLAIYKSGLDVEHDFLIAGEFELVFECKPQRYLKSGETIITIGEWGETTTYEGAIAQFENPNGWLAVKSLTVDIEPVQAGSGTPSPDNVRPITGWTGCEVVVSPTEDAQDGTTYTVSWQTEAGTVYGGTVDVVSGVLTVTHKVKSGQIDAIAADTYANVVYGRFAKGTDNASLDNYDYHGEISNMFPISAAPTGGWDSTNAIGGIFFAAQKGNYWVGFPKGTTLAEMQTATANTKLCYKLATPTTYQLDPVQVACLLGHNNVWSDSGNTTIEVGIDPKYVINPTLFDAKPQLQVWGYGEIDMGGQTITVNNEVLGNILLANSGGSSTVTLDMNNMMNGDQFTVSGAENKFWFMPETNYDIAIYNIGTGTNCTANIGYGNELYVYPSSATFVNGTASALNWSVTATVNVSEHKGSYNVNTSATFSGSVSYDGDSTVLFSMSVSPASFTHVRNIYKSTKTQEIYGYSTKSVLGNPLYIDLDIGECYNTDSGSPVSVNDAVSMSAELPVLKPGANEITYDNTITDLKIVPRWWKV